MRRNSGASRYYKEPLINQTLFRYETAGGLMFSKFCLRLGLYACVFALPAHAGVVKWVDEQGQVHYGDRVPPQYIHKERDVLNQRGIVVESVPAAKTPEELAEERRLEAVRQEIERIAAEQAFRDKVLLDTFTTERDIVAARDARLETIDSQVQLTESIIEDHQQQMAEVGERVKRLEQLGRAIPENLTGKLVALSKQLEISFQYIEQKGEERKRIVEQFDRDLKRFRELKGLPAPRAEDTVPSGGGETTTPLATP